VEAYSPTKTNDLVLEEDTSFEQQEVVVTLKIGGLPFVGYPDYCHGEKIETALPPSVKTSLLDTLGVLDADMRIYGEYLGESLYLTSIWVENQCMAWVETKEYGSFLNMPLPLI
jgi:hypothetical protein